MSIAIGESLVQRAAQVAGCSCWLIFMVRQRRASRRFSRGIGSRIRGFLRALHGISIPPNRWIPPLYAADLVRGDDGRFCRADRSHAIAICYWIFHGKSHRHFACCRLFFVNAMSFASHIFYWDAGKMLALSARTHQENPRIVLLTPGPYNETYFEHAYLARYLEATRWCREMI